MTTTLVRRDDRGPLGEMFDWLAAPLTLLRPVAGRPMRVEDGTFSRSVTLPTGADEEHTEAHYGHGILEVTVKIATSGASKTARKVPVRQNQHIKAT